jgi:NDP-sugar pyrophosphorylase family protein
MAGRGQRFRDAGFADPKPLIAIAGRSMIEWSLKSLEGLDAPHRIIFVALEEDLEKGLGKVLASRGEIVAISGVTEGAVNTTLMASHLLDEEAPLVIANCDQYLNWNFSQFLSSAEGFDGSVVVFESNNPHHSYISAEGPRVVRVEEKKVISSLACGGVYYYRKTADYLLGARKLLEDDERTNGEFYISPIFNKLIARGQSITYFKVLSDYKHMLGTPEEVQLFIENLKERGIST